MSRSFRIKIEDFRGGLAPGYFETEYPNFGNTNMAGKAQGIDLIDPSYLRQGVAMTSLTGTSVTGDVRVLDEPVEENKTYGVAGDTVYEVTDTSVSAIHTLPTNATGEDVAYYQGDLFVSYNTDASGVVAKYDITGDSWNDTWQDSLDKSVPHRMEVGGLDFLYIADGSNVASYDGVSDTFAGADLDLPNDHIIQSFQFTRQYLQVLTNTPSLSTGARSSLFLWDTTSNSWNVEYKFRERITNNFVLNGITYLHYDDVGRSRLGLLDGSEIRPAKAFSGDSPKWYQVSTYKGFVAWVADGNVLLWGAPEAFLDPITFPFLTNANASTLAAPFGELILGSTDSLEIQSSGSFEQAGYWKSLLFSLSGDDKSGVIDSIKINFNQLPTGKTFTVKLVNSAGTEKFSQQVSGDGKTKFWKKLGIQSDDIRVELHFDSDSSDTVEVRDVILRGHTTV